LGFRKDHLGTHSPLVGAVLFDSVGTIEDADGTAEKEKRKRPE
jgi:hypothetical protein